jgi:hypothetical protein
VIEQKVTLEKILAEEKISIDNRVFNENKVIVVTDRFKDIDYIDASTAPIIKEIKNKIGKVHIASRNPEFQYTEFREAQYNLPLIILEKVVLPFVLGIASNRICKWIDKYREDKKMEPQNNLIKEPTVKIRYYVTDDKKYFEITGPATDVVKEISKQLSKKDN